MNSLLPMIITVLFVGVCITTCSVRLLIEKILHAAAMNRAQKWLDEQQGKSLDYND